MCGITLCFLPDRDRAAAAIERMVGVQTHRGPDSAGTRLETVPGGGCLALGHNRLSIIDLTDHACQPMTSADGRYVLVYNGEVYNYKEIAAELGAAALPQGSTGDTAVVLAALIAWGPDALARFNGMWALALYDRVEGTLLLSRDRFGKKPLYYHQDGDSFYVASEIKAILAGTGRRFPIDPRVAVPFLARGLIDVSSETYFEGIAQFPPASWQLVTPGRDARIGVGTTRYWQHPFERGEQPVAGSTSPEAIRDLFIDAVGLRLRSDVPVGVLLSGGIDSSAILGSIRRLGALDNVSVLSVISDSAASSEEPFIDVMTRFAGCRADKVNVSDDPHALLDALPEATWHNDGPMAGFSPLAHMRLMRLAAQRGLKVLLTGQGADEQLGGYNKFFYFFLMGLAHERRYAAAARTLAQFAARSNVLREFRLSEALRYVGRRKLAAGTFLTPGRERFDTLDIGFQGSYPRREWMDLVQTSVPALLHNEDRMSMSQSLEMRAPFLDYRLVELLARVHPSEKFAGGWTKAIFRDAIRDLVPPEISYRRDKRGFNVPETEWLQGALRDRVRRTFESELMAERLGYVDGARLRALFDRFTANRGILGGRQFFRAYAFETFLRRFESSIAA